MKSTGDRRYRALLRLLPREFRRRHGPAMEATFAARLGRVGGPSARARLWLGEAVDLTKTALRLRAARRTNGEGKTMRGSRTAWRDDLSAATRSLRRAPATTVTALVTLALGIGSATGLYSAVDRVLIRPVDLPEADRLVAVWRALGNGSSFRVSPDQEVVDQLRGSDGLFDHVLGFAGNTVVLSGEQDPIPLEAAWSEPGFFELAEARPVAGRLLGVADAETAVVMISERLWRRLGSDPDLIGGTLRLDGEPYTVVGVAPDGLRRPSPLVQPAEVWLPLPPEAEAEGEGAVRVTSVLARLAPGVSLEAARAGVEGINRGRVEAGAQGEIELMPLGDLETRALREPVTALMAAVLLLLALSWASVAGLLLARAETRSREAAVRAALGATAARLARQQLIEGLLLSAAAAAVGLGLARAGIAALRRLRPDDLRLLDGMSLDGRVLAFAVGAALLATLLFGALPALRTGHGWVAGLLRGARTGGSAGARARGWLVLGELALSFTLLVGAVQVVRTLAGAADRDTGFEHEGLVVAEYRLPSWRFPTDADRAAAHRAILDRVRALPGVTAALGRPPTRGGIYFGKLSVEGGPEPEAEAGDEVYFGGGGAAGWAETLGVRMLRGRTFQPGDGADDEYVWLLGESLARELFPPDGDAVGRRIRLSAGAEWGTVVGVMGDLLVGGGLTTPDYGQLWRAAAPEDGGTIVARSTGDPSALAGELRAAIRGVDREIPVDEIATVEDHYRQALARERLVAMLLGSFAATAALLAAVGLYGVLAQVVRLRRREFGIRLSLGAAPGRIFVGVLRSGALTVSLGLVMGVAGAAAGLKLLGSRVPGLEGSDPRAFIASGALLAAVSFLAIALPARRASCADPVEVLRTE